MIPYALNRLGINPIIEEISPPAPPEKVLYILNVYAKDNLTETPIANKINGISVDGISQPITIVNDHIPLSVYDYRFPVDISLEADHYYSFTVPCNLPSENPHEVVAYLSPINDEVRDQIQNTWTYDKNNNQDFDSHYLVIDNNTGLAYQCASYPSSVKSLYVNNGKLNNTSGTLILSASRDGRGTSTSDSNEAFISKHEISAYNLTVYPMIYDWTRGSNSGTSTNATNIFYTRILTFSVTDNKGITYFNNVTDPSLSGLFWIVGKIKTDTDEVTMFENKIAYNKSQISVVCPELGVNNVLSALKLS